MSYEIVIGLEVHLQLNTKSKVFCGCSTNFGSAPNTQTCPVCLGFPGSLPVLNRQALELGAKVAIALNCQIAKEIRFDRKNYFYPDLPKDYQISQFDQPLAQRGILNIITGESEKKIKIRRVHLEEDTGKLFHQKDHSLIDFNRSGMPLLEIVSEPDMNSPEEAYLYLTALKSILEYIDVSDCNMEEGSLRCDANISIRKKGDNALGTKTEIKNMNSFKGVKLALEYESKRQAELLEGGKKIIQETRLYNTEKCVTEPMRSKEEAHDYRYFPEPDLVPFDFEESFLEKIHKGIPELPEPKRNRFIKDYRLSNYDSAVIVSDKDTADYFEKCAGLYGNPKAIANWLTGDVFAYMKENNVLIKDLNLKPEHLSDMLKMIDSGVITGKIAKTLLIEIIATGADPRRLVKEKGLEQISDVSLLEATTSQVIRENPKSAEDFKNGKENAIMFLVGKVMQQTKGRADPNKVNEMLREKLKGVK
ncbi:MAG: Asp-tRNA(Asn)/Glu-tRNA(Gln) amidotransferase GatCAB subunit B [Candidatus Omnitrophica bacterium CG_4_9_14_0_2_um_filter_42_8]|nr:MAG: Asp-tRNA(Asn)/Glu-tRNA(Gln) amidotransferase GatCAB subunit B [Candidatus Omnitrophica bacterium CG22_combo_CG10-13_8_21_14_all_43_16]PJC48272.1 MAG: Asp-tRNA(Asn)/Glu-tRNA(Gln) amidotransferase GatCAB subunit B [Candidatus Omnitrophica bacterium CG_4_9_14_0_2_um_filter_42_8]